MIGHIESLQCNVRLHLHVRNFTSMCVLHENFFPNWLGTFDTVLEAFG